MLEWIIIAIVLTISVFSYFKRNVKLKIFAVVFLVCILLLREISIDTYVRSSVWERRTKELNSEQYQQFKDGANEILNASQKTRLHVLGIYAILLAFYIRKTRNSIKDKRHESDLPPKTGPVETS